MVSFDTNVAYEFFDERSPFHDKAQQLFDGFADNPSIVVAEQMLVELYVLLRNPVVTRRPPSPAAAVDAIEHFRSNPSWRLVDVPPDCRSLMDSVWRFAAQPQFAKRRIHDVRLAKTLLHHGVDTFYTRNMKDFRDVGFARVIDPFA